MQAYLQTSVPKDARNAAFEAVRTGLENRLNAPRALHPDGDLVKTSTEVLRCIFNLIGNALGDDLESTASQPHEDTDAAKGFRLEARAALNDSPPSSPQEGAEDANFFLLIVDDLLRNVLAALT